MNPPSLLQIVERLERLAGKLPSRIQKAVLSELTPLKQLFLQQRPPRFLFAGPSTIPAGKIIGALFSPANFAETDDSPVPRYRWFDVSFSERGTISILDTRGADDAAAIQLQAELKYQTADIIFFLNDDGMAQGADKRDLDNLTRYCAWNKTSEACAKVIGIVIPLQGEAIGPNQANLVASRLQSELRSNVAGRQPFLDTLRLLPAGPDQGIDLPNAEAQRLMSILARELPNEARMEMIERSFRASTEFIGALGANVGAAMLLREGTRALLKFFPGWGNVVCGLVAASGTYAIGRAATVFFIDGVSLKDARRTYLASRKKRARLTLQSAESAYKEHSNGR